MGAHDDASSDCSWALVDGLDEGFRLHRGDDDTGSEASWERWEENTPGRRLSPSIREGPSTQLCRHAVAVSIQTFVPQEVMSNPERRPCWRHANGGVPSFVELVRAGECECALALLRTSEKPGELASQRDENGDSALAWAAYKAKGSRTAWFELICQLLVLCPSDVQKRSKNNKFLPLHEAAWGNAPAAVAMLLSAAYPTAVNDRAPGQTPYEIGHYHHSKRGRGYRTYFSWPAPEQMLRIASTLREESSWLDTLSALRFPAVGTPSYQKWVEALPLLEKQLALVASFFSSCESLPSISEKDKDMDMKNTVYPGQNNRRQRPPRGRVMSVAPMLASSDDVNYLREPRCKAMRNGQGPSRRTWPHNAYKEFMRVMDGAGATHCLGFHAKKPRHGSGKKSKWPSKATIKRQIAWERDEKGQYLVSHYEIIA